MRQIFKFWYALFLIFALSVAGIARVNSGSVLILSFDGDAIHMAQIVLRMVEGQVPHVDFLTPLGAMAFLPIVWLIDFGFGIGAAFGYAPVLIGVAALPAIYWTGTTRFSPGGAMVFAVVVLVQLTAFLHGGTEPTVTASMYYNNWCWAISSIAVVLCVLPNPQCGRTATIIESIILGLCVGFLFLVKATFAIFLLPVILLSLVWRAQFKLLGFGVGVALLFLLAVTVPLGVLEYWQGYISDLLFVAGSQIRAQPGDALRLMILSPVHLVGIVGLVSGFVLFRQAKLGKEAFLIAALGAGWVLITHQNWQNDPHWFILGGLILFGLSKDILLYNRYGWPISYALRIVGVGLMVLGTPLLVAQAQSLLIHSSLNPDRFETVLSDPKHYGLKFKNVQSGRFTVETPNVALASLNPKPNMINGEELPSCQKTNGLTAELVETGKLLDADGTLSGASVLYADWVNGLWLFSNVAPLKGGAPWYYGGTTGFNNADYLVVPLCPMGKGVRRIILEEIRNDPEIQFTEQSRNDLFILLKRAD